MPTISIIMPRLGVVPLPKIFKYGRYSIFFWSNENDEPVHVHIAIGNMTSNATKIWLTSAGGCLLAHNKSRIPQKNLNNLLKVIQIEHPVILEKWKSYFDTDDIKFYC